MVYYDTNEGETIILKSNHSIVETVSIKDLWNTNGWKNNKF